MKPGYDRAARESDKFFLCTRRALKKVLSFCRSGFGKGYLITGAQASEGKIFYADQQNCLQMVEGSLHLFRIL
jgi:hypothetical protein